MKPLVPVGEVVEDRADPLVGPGGVSGELADQIGDGRVERRQGGEPRLEIVVERQRPRRRAAARRRDAARARRPSSPRPSVVTSRPKTVPVAGSNRQFSSLSSLIRTDSGEDRHREESVVVLDDLDLGAHRRGSTGRPAAGASSSSSAIDGLAGEVAHRPAGLGVVLVEGDGAQEARGRRPTWSIRKQVDRLGPRELAAQLDHRVEGRAAVLPPAPPPRPVASEPSARVGTRAPMTSPATRASGRRCAAPRSCRCPAGARRCARRDRGWPAGRRWSVHSRRSEPGGRRGDGGQPDAAGDRADRHAVEDQQPEPGDARPVARRRRCRSTTIATIARRAAW